MARRHPSNPAHQDFFRAKDGPSASLCRAQADDLAAPCDVTVRRQTGVRLMGTAATTAHLDAILKRWRSTGEGNSGGYIGIAHWLVLARPTVECLRDAIEDLVADDALASVLEVVTEPDWP